MWYTDCKIDPLIPFPVSTLIQCDFAALLVQEIELRLQSLNVGSPCNFLWPVECGRSEAATVVSLGLKLPCSFHCLS